MIDIKRFNKLIYPGKSMKKYVKPGENTSESFQALEKHNAVITVNRAQIINCFANSNLFSSKSVTTDDDFSKKPVKVEFFNDKNVYEDGKVLNIFWEFFQLNQFDLDVWLCLMQISDSNFTAKFTLYSLIKAMGLTDSRHNYDRLNRSLYVLSRTTVSFVFRDTVLKRRKIYTGSLIGDGVIDDDDDEFEFDDLGNYSGSSEHVVRLMPMLKSVLDDKYNQNWSYIDMKQRKALSSAVSKKIHAFFCTNAGFSSKKFFMTKEQFFKCFCPNTETQRAKFFSYFRRKVLPELKESGCLLEFSEDKTSVAMRWVKPIGVSNKFLRQDKLIRRKME